MSRDRYKVVLSALKRILEDFGRVEVQKGVNVFPIRSLNSGKWLCVTGFGLFNVSLSNPSGTRKFA